MPHHNRAQAIGVVQLGTFQPYLEAPVLEAVDAVGHHVRDIHIAGGVCAHIVEKLRSGGRIALDNRAPDDIDLDQFIYVRDVEPITYQCQGQQCRCQVTFSACVWPPTDGGCLNP